MNSKSRIFSVRLLGIVLLILFAQLVMGCESPPSNPGNESIFVTDTTLPDTEVATVPETESCSTEAETEAVTQPETDTRTEAVTASESEPISETEPETFPEVELPFVPHTKELPIVSINTNGTAVNSKDYVDMNLTLANVEDPLLEISGQIRLRGNSTFHMPKKPYRIKFDQKQSLFDLDKAKSWVLLADYIDPSTLHNYTALTLAGSSENFDFVPTPHKVNLYLNGEYQGIYTLCEQVQEQEGRLDLEFDINPNMSELSDFNFLICMNHNAPEKEGAEEGVTYFYLSNCDRYFELEYPTLEDFPSREQFDVFFTALEDYMWETVDAFLHIYRIYLTENVDIDTLIDFYIIDMIMGERDHHWKSVFMYYRGADGDPKLHFGPPWDYDFCMFTEWSGRPNDEFDLSNDFNPQEACVFFRPLLSYIYFTRQVKSRYQDHFSKVLPQVIEQVQASAAAMPVSLELNQEKWYDYDASLTQKNLDFFVCYLQFRKAALDSKWG